MDSLIPAIADQLARALPIAFFVALWLGVAYLLDRFGGWDALRKHYRLAGSFHGRRWWFQSGDLSGMSYRGCLTVGANEEGLYLRMLWPFALWAAPLFIPWSDVSVTTRAGWPIFRLTELRFACAPSIPLRISTRLRDRLARAAGSAWPGAPADSR
jgi:hypothetical protein